MSAIANRASPFVSWPRVILLIAAVYLAVLAAKWCVIERYGSDVPYMDQWAGEAILAYKPMLETGSIPFASVVHPHNEHRIATTRIFAAIVTRLNGQWDPRLQMTVNAVVQAIVPILLMLVLHRRVGAGALFGYAAFVAIAFALPVSRENLLISFQVQFFFAQLFGVLHVWGSLATRPLSPLWWAAQVAGVLDVFSLANGGTKAAAVLFTMIMRAARERRATARDYGAFTVLLMLIVLGMIAVNRVSGHDVLRAASFSEFVMALASATSWPFGSRSGMGIVVWAPMVLLAATLWRAPRVNHDGWVLLGLGLSSFAVAAALAYTRGSGVRASRYLDLYVLGHCVNAAALAWLVSTCSAHRRLASVGGMVVWIGAVLIPTARTSWTEYRETIPAEAVVRKAQGERLARFVREGDRSAIADAPEGALPSPNRAMHFFFDVLTNPALRAALSPSLREWVPFTSPSTRVAAPGLESLPASPQGDLRSVATKGPRTIVQAELGELTPRAVLQFYVAGSPGEGSAEVRLISDHGSRGSIAISTPTLRWKRAHLPVGGGRVRFELRATGTGAWVAITQPVEIGRLSWWAHHVRKHSGLIALGALILAVGAGTAQFWQGAAHRIESDLL